MPIEDRGRVLLAIARGAIERALGHAADAPEDAPWLAEPGATFVTLKRDGELRGCIGSLEPYRPLRDDVKGNALAAAFRDPRFPPLSAEELDGLEVEVSLLSPLEALSFADKADLLAQLRPGIDGVVLEYGRHRGTFLPQVWEQLPDPRDFFARLTMKAGLPSDFWAPQGLRLLRYTVQKWCEQEVQHD